MSQHSGTLTTASIPTTSQRTSIGSPLKNGAAIEECPLCYHNVTLEEFYTLLACSHVACRNCLERYLVIEILESRTDIGTLPPLSKHFRHRVYSNERKNLFYFQTVHSAQILCILVTFKHYYKTTKK